MKSYMPKKASFSESKKTVLMKINESTVITSNQVYGYNISYKKVWTLLVLNVQICQEVRGSTYGLHIYFD